jgi:hypothetical protein
MSLPALVQKGGAIITGTSPLIFTFPNPVVGGNTIIVGANCFLPSPFTAPTISDNMGNVYTPIVTHVRPSYCCIGWYAKNVTGGTITITITDAVANSFSFIRASYNEVSGLDPTSPLDGTPAAGDNLAGGSGPWGPGSVTTSQANDLVFSFVHNDTTLTRPSGFTAAGGVGAAQSAYRVEGAPRGYTPEWTVVGNSGIGFTAAFKAVDTTSTVTAAALAAIGHGVNCNDYAPVNTSAGSTTTPGNGALLGDLTLLNAWCRANGISVALVQDSQRSAKDLIDELLTVGNSAAVYSGDKLNIIPYDEVSNAGYGSIYVAPTAAGPVFNLTDQDFVSDGKNPFVKFTRKRRTDCDNVVSIEYVERSLDYAHNVVSELDQKAIALYGPRKGGTLSAAELGVNLPSGSKSLMSISNKTVAQAIASVLAKRSAAGVNQWAFTVKSEWMHLEAMDLGTISDSRLGLVNKAVRLTSVKETSKRTYDCLADEFIYGLNHPSAKVVTAATGSLVKSSIYPGLVNPPIIFQPPPPMLPAGASPQIWFLVSGADPNYGGCVAYLSLDGGASYPTVLGAIGPATTGVLTADYPSHADPDTVDTLAVDLSESNGVLSPESTAVADNFSDPCFVAGASSFEAVCPTSVALTSAEHFALGAYIRRAVLGTVAMDHPIASRFGVLDAAVFKLNLPAAWVGLTLYFKFAAYNKTFGQQNNLADCVPYTFTPAASYLPGDFYFN